MREDRKDDVICYLLCSLNFVITFTYIVGNRPNITPLPSLCKTCDNEPSGDGDTPALSR